MKTLFTFRSAINQVKAIAFITLVSTLSLVYPEIVMASSLQTDGQNTALVFEVKNPIQKSEQIQKSITYAEIVQEDPLVKNLQSYLDSLKSPLAKYAGEIVKQPQWQRALAISWVESNMCIHQVDNNCSGIGVAPGHKLWREYPTQLDWFKDMTQLLEKPIYKEKYTTFKKMKGVYVQPGSNRWVYGAQAKFDALTNLTEKSEIQKTQLTQINTSSKLALATFPKISNVE